MRFSGRYDDGAVAVLTAVLAVVLFAMAALVVDLGIARDNRRQAQNTADAAALAAANALYAQTPINLNTPGDFEAAVAAAKDYAEKNYGTTEAEWAECVSDAPLDYVYPGTGTNCISFDQAPNPNNALVVIPFRKQPTLFGGVVGYSGVSIGALAQARIAPGGAWPCTFCVIGDAPHTLGNGNLRAQGGNIWFNGDVQLSNNGEIVSSEDVLTGNGGNLYLSGDASGPALKFNGTKYKTRSPRIVDPLSATVLPFATQATLTPGVDPCVDGPGIYDGYSGGACTFPPGLYVFTGDVRLSGGEGLNAPGSTLYFTCGSGTTPRPCAAGGESGAAILVTGQGSFNIEAPTAETYPDVPEELYGFALVYDRYNTAEIGFRGNGAQTLDGTLYAASATMWNRGNGCSVVSTSMVVIADIRFSGNNACFNTTFDPNRNVRPSDGERALVR